MKTKFAQSIALAKGQENVKRVTTKSIGQEETTIESESLAAREVYIPSSEIGISFGLTVSLPKKFEFCRIDVSTRVPCNESNKDEAYEKARNWTIEKLKKEVAEIREMEKSKAAGGEQEKDPVL